MCGYLGNMHDHPMVRPLLDQLGIPLLYPRGQYYQRRIHDGLITAGAGGHELTRALWWYALRPDGGNMVPNPDITSFNARNLDGRMWRRAINERRGIVLATEVGESLGRDRYLMRGQDIMPVGAVYKDWQAPGGEIVRSMAVITRPPHERFSRYYDKSIPCFLPPDADFLTQWLDPAVPADSPEIADLLDRPRIYTDLEVIPVKTFKRGEKQGETEWLEAD